MKITDEMVRAALDAWWSHRGKGSGVATFMRPALEAALAAAPTDPRGAKDGKVTRLCEAARDAEEWLTWLVLHEGHDPKNKMIIVELHAALDALEVKP